MGNKYINCITGTELYQIVVQRTIKSNEQKQDDNEILNREDENLYRYNGDIGPKSEITNE